MTSWEQFQRDWKGKRVLIMGLGLQGRGVGDAKVFAEAGAEVTVTDLKSEVELSESIKKLTPHDIRFVLGRHEEKDFKATDVVIRNPDVPRTSPYLNVARQAMIPIKMDSSLFAKYCPVPIIGITGTRGKTTTAMMIYEIIKKHFKGHVYLGGNVPGNATLELIQEVSKSPHTKTMIVLELSSWELAGWDEERISPHIAVFTNFYEDHLNRYRSMDAYFKDKLVILGYQNKSDWAVLNEENEWTEQAASHTKAQISWFSSGDIPEEITLSIPGDHNRSNAAAALGVARIIGISETASLKTLMNFKGVPFRLEPIATIDGVTYVNDTTSTTPVAAAAALRAMSSPLILIAGGSSKNLDLTPFIKEIQLKSTLIRKMVLLPGAGTDELLQTLGRDHRVDGVFSNFRDAIARARTFAKPGDTVLLSPACASFSMFKNEFDRGEQFNQIVRSWQHEK